MNGTFVSLTAKFVSNEAFCAFQLVYDVDIFGGN